MKKVLTVVMTLALGLFSLNFAHAAPSNQAVIKNNPDTIEIIMATFGANDKRCDAKAIVSKACDKKISCELPAIVEICGPATKMEPRELTVLYACRERSNLVSATEGNMVRIACPR